MIFRLQFLYFFHTNIANSISLSNSMWTISLSECTWSGYNNRMWLSKNRVVMKWFKTYIIKSVCRNFPHPTDQIHVAHAQVHFIVHSTLHEGDILPDHPTGEIWIEHIHQLCFSQCSLVKVDIILPKTSFGTKTMWYMWPRRQFLANKRISKTRRPLPSSLNSLTWFDINDWWIQSCLKNCKICPYNVTWDINLFYILVK